MKFIFQYRETLLLLIRLMLDYWKSIWWLKMRSAWKSHHGVAAQDLIPNSNKAIWDPNNLSMNLISYYYSGAMYNSTFIIRLVIFFCVLDLLYWNGRVQYTPLAVLILLSYHSIYANFLFSLSIISQWQYAETNTSFPLFFINTICLCSAANSCPFSSSVWACSVLFLRAVSVYCPFLAGRCAYALMHELHGHSVKE